MSTLASPAFPHGPGRAVPSAHGVDTPPLRLLERRPAHARGLPVAARGEALTITTATRTAQPKGLGWLERLARWADAHPPHRQAGSWVRL